MKKDLVSRDALLKRLNDLCDATGDDIDIVPEIFLLIENMPIAANS